jgi:hypothetical protein
MSYTQFFTCLKREYKTRHVAAFDTEGIGGEGNFLCGSVVSERETCFFTAPGDMLKYLSCSDFANELIAAHNLEYDLSLLTGGHLADWELLYIDSRLLQAVRHDTSRHTWTLIDSRNLFAGFSVEQLGQIVATPKLRLPDPLQYKIRHGVHWVDLDLIEQNQVRQYNLRDALIVYRALVWLQDELNALGGQLQSTIAGCAMDLFRRKHLKTFWRTPDREINNFYRAAYYGARVEPIEVGTLMGVNCYDYNSLYPSVQCTMAFPHPAHFRMDPQPHVFGDFARYEGAAMCEIRVPDVYLPPLPARYQNRLFFPAGRLTSVWPLVELRHALDCGAEILRLDWVFYSTQSFNPFSELINDLFARRLSYKRAQDTRERIFKLLLNASYGRYGIRSDGALQKLVKYDSSKPDDFYIGGELKWYGNELYVLIPCAGEMQPAYSCVSIVAQIAAGARIRLHQSMLASGQDTIYVDTDSLMTHGWMMTGEGMGEMRLEHQGAHALIAGPKEYLLHTPTRVLASHVKGVPQERQEDFIRFGKAQFERPVTLREALQRGDVPARWKTVVKRRQDVVPKRCLERPLRDWQDYSSTRPWDWIELQYQLSPQ